jgi:hypothetical protein
MQQPTLAASVVRRPDERRMPMMARPDYTKAFITARNRAASGPPHSTAGTCPMRAQTSPEIRMRAAQGLAGGGLENRRHRPAIPATGKSRTAAEYSNSGAFGWMRTDVCGYVTC